MTKPQNAKNAPLFNTRLRSVRGAREREGSSQFAGVPRADIVDATEFRPLVNSPSRRRICVSRAGDDDPAHVSLQKSSKQGQSRPTRGWLAHHPLPLLSSCQFFFWLPRGQTRMFWIHRSQLRSTNFVFFKTNTLCAPRQIFSSLAPSKSRGCDWLRKKRISILPSFL